MFENNTYASIGESLRLDYGQWLLQCSSDGAISLLGLSDVLHTLESDIAPASWGGAVGREIALNDFFSRDFISLADAANSEEKPNNTAVYKAPARQQSTNVPSASQQAKDGAPTWQQNAGDGRLSQPNQTKSPVSASTLPSGETSAAFIQNQTEAQVRAQQGKGNSTTVNKNVAAFPTQWGQTTNTPSEKGETTAQPISEKSPESFQKISGFMDWARGSKTTGRAQPSSIEQPLSNDPQGNNTVAPTPEPEPNTSVQRQPPAFPSVPQSNALVSENQTPQQSTKHPFSNLGQDIRHNALPFSNKQWENTQTTPNPDIPLFQETLPMQTVLNTQQVSLPTDWPQAIETYPLDPIIASNMSPEDLIAQLTQHLTEAYQRYYGHAH